MSSKIKLRPYHPDDYAQVVKIYQDGIKEVNTNVYQSFYNGLFPQLIFCELLAFSVGCMVGLHCFNSSHLEAIIYGVISLLLFCCLSLWIRFTWTRNYIEYVMKSDMGDPELSFWMREPNMFYIATPTSDENRIFGLVGCSKISDTVAELFRLTVIPEARNLGIGRMLVMKVVEHARSIGCQKVYLATWRTMYSANALYTKCGFQNIGNRSSKVFFKGLPMKYIFPILGERIPEFILDI